MHFVYGYEDFDRPGRTDVDDDQGLSAHVGYRLDSYFAFDLEWEFMTGFEAEDDVEQSNVVTHSLMIDARFYPLSTRIQPFFKAGFGLVVAEDDDNLIDDGVAFGVRAGAGLEFYVTDHIVLSAGADYVVPATDLQDIRYVSIRSGLAYRF
jgi:opacity protein-like surface antigen